VHPLQPGDPRKIGPYEIIARIGAGGMGTVFLGEFGTQQVAVKLMLPVPGKLEMEAEFRFYEEAKVLFEINSEYVARIFEWQFKEEPYWFATEYIAGPNLQDEVDAHGPLDSDALHYLIDCCNEGLRALHESQIVHQDVKPLNVVLSDGGPKIIDLGLVRNQETAELFEKGDVLGTPLYMSPEQWQGVEVTSASDYFSLGVTIFQAAVGRLPWGSLSTSELREAISACQIDIPDEMDEIVAQVIKGLIVSDPNQRLSYHDIFKLVNQGRSEPAHRARRDLQRVASPGRYSEAIADAPLTPQDVLDARNLGTDPGENPLLNAKPKLGIVEQAEANPLLPGNSAPESNFAKNPMTPLISKRHYDRSAIPSTPAKLFLRAQLEPINQGMDFLNVIPSAPKTFPARHWCDELSFEKVSDVFSFINWQFHLYSSNEPHDYYELVSRETDSQFLNTLMNAEACLMAGDESDDIFVARYWLAYFAIELAGFAADDEVVAQLVLFNFVQNVKVAACSNPKQTDARSWLNILYNADGHGPPDMEFAVLTYSAYVSLPKLEQQIECIRVAAMNGLPNALGTWTWMCLTTGQVNEGYLAFLAAWPHLGNAYPENTEFGESFAHEVANARSNAALCQLALGEDVDSALEVLDECVSQGATDGAFARAVLLLRAGRDTDAKDYVKNMSTELRSTINIWPEIEESSVGWFKEFASDVIRVGQVAIF